MRILAPALLLLAAAPLPAQAPVRALSFNIRYGTAADGDHAWPNRRGHVVTLIRDHAPHLIGFQEALRFQLDELEQRLHRYQEIGVGRDDGKTAGEYAAIWVDTLRFGVVTSGTQSPSLQKAVGMGYVPAALAKPGSEIFVDVRGKALRAKVVAMPFLTKTP